MDEAATLLRQREARGLEITTTTRLVMMLVTFAVQLIVATRPIELLAAGLPGLAALVCGGLLLLLWRGGRLGLVGFSGAAMDVAIVGALPLMWYAPPEMASIAASFLPKAHSYLLLALGLIVMNGLALRPRYPLTVCAGAMLVNLSFYALAFADPRTETSTDWAVSVLGPALNPFQLLVDQVVIGLTGLLVAWLTLGARATVREAIRLQMERGQLARYFSPNVVAGIVEGGADFLRPGGREQEVVVLFCDLAGFTRLAAGMRAGEALAFLSDYQARMVAEIFRQGGTLDKFIGDGIMASFGTPEPAPDAADRAVAAALAMRRAFAALNAERAALGKPAIAQRIGIHAGPALVGNVGTPERLEYTVVGDTVNVASRIEKAGKAIGESLLISEAVRQRLSRAPPLRPLPMITLEGQQEPIQLYAVESGQ